MRVSPLWGLSESSANNPETYSHITRPLETLNPIKAVWHILGWALDGHEATTSLRNIKPFGNINAWPYGLWYVSLPFVNGYENTFVGPAVFPHVV